MEKMIEAAWGRGPLARIPGEPRLAARHAGGPPALPGEHQRRAFFPRVSAPETGVKTPRGNL